MFDTKTLCDHSSYIWFGFEAIPFIFLSLGLFSAFDPLVSSPGLLESPSLVLNSFSPSHGHQFWAPLSSVLPVAKFMHYLICEIHKLRLRGEPYCATGEI